MEDIDKRYAEAHRNIEKAINEFINVDTEEPGFSTGWVLVSSVSAATDSRYIHLTSEGQPYHATIGLLVMAKREVEQYGDMASIAGMFSSEDDDD